NFFQLAPFDPQLPGKSRLFTPKISGVLQFCWTENWVSARIRLLKHSMLTLRLSCAKRHGTHLFAVALLGSLALFSEFTCGKADAQDVDFRSTATNSARTAVATNNHDQASVVVHRS